MLRRAVLQILTDVSELVTASIISAMAKDSHLILLIIHKKNTF
jgi:hypothetical protein